MYQGQPLTDNAAIPAELRGYVQIALDIGLMSAFPAEVRRNPDGSFTAIPGPRFEPVTVLNRADLAQQFVVFAEVFDSGF